MLTVLAGLSTSALDGLSMPSCLPILHRETGGHSCNQYCSKQGYGMSGLAGLPCRTVREPAYRLAYLRPIEFAHILLMRAPRGLAGAIALWGVLGRLVGSLALKF